MIGAEGHFDLFDPAIQQWCGTRRGGGFPSEDTAMPNHQIWDLVTRKLKGWKEPCHDRICGFWWKKFRQASDRLKEIVWGWTGVNASDIPVGENSTYPHQGSPDQHRPITCLNTSYKLLMAILTEVLYEHIQLYDILPKEQYTVQRGCRGCPSDRLNGGERGKAEASLTLSCLDRVREDI